MPAYWLGIDLGTTCSAAAICWPAADGLRVQVVPLSGRSYAMPSVLFLPGDGSLVVGEEAQRRLQADPYRGIREFKSRIGDEIPLLVAGSPYYAHYLAAEFVSWLVQYVTQQEGERPEAVALTCPASWGPDKTALFERAVRDAGVPNVAMLTEPQAAAISYASQQDLPPGATLAVYDLGAARFGVTVLRKESPTSFTILGRSEGIEGLGGLSFDEVIFEYVCAAAGVPIDELDLYDRDLAAQVAQLRRECVEAKETLSASNDAIISVTLGGTQHWVRLTRAEFEEMIRPDLDRTIEAMHRAFGSADVVAELATILLTGGSSRTPLVAQLIAAEFGRPPAVGTDPKAAVAMGAARYSAPAAAQVRDQSVPPIPGGDGERTLAGLAAALRHPSRKALLAAAALIVLVVGGGLTALRTPVLSGLTSHHSNPHGATASGGLAPSVSGSGSSPTPSAQSSAKPTSKATAGTKTTDNGLSQVASGPTSAAAAAAQASNKVTAPATRTSTTKPPMKTSTKPVTPPTPVKPSTPPASTTPSPPPSTSTPSAPPTSTTPPPPTGSTDSSAATPSTSGVAGA